MEPSPSGREIRAAGTGRLGCLFRLVLVGFAAYYGIQLLDPYVRYLRIRDAIQQQAAFAVNLSDTDIRQRIQEEARKLGLPDQAQNVHIQRYRGERILIWIEYREVLELPGFRREVHFRPQAEARLWKL